MKTSLNMIPNGFHFGKLNIDASEWLPVKAVDTDVAYALTASVNGKKYKGSMKLLAENTANSSGTQRLLMKVDVPLINESADDKGCCCTGAVPDSVSTVSAHLVLAVPKSVAAGITNGDQAAYDHVTVAIRLLQQAISSACQGQVDVETSEQGTALAGNCTVTLEENPDGSGNAYVGPTVYFDPAQEQVYMTEIAPTAPLWGLTGGLRSLA